MWREQEEVEVDEARDGSQQRDDADDDRERSEAGEQDQESRAGRPPGEPTIDPDEDDPDREGEDRFDAG